MAVTKMKGYILVGLFDPLKIGELTIPNRIIMAPLTRSRAGQERIPNALMAKYYQQRASAGLIIAEATSISPMGVGYADTPGIWSSAQIEGWKLITQAVHQAQGRIFLQLWHVGRISDPIFLNGKLPVAPSAIAAPGHVSLLRPQRPYVVPRALEPKEIPDIIESYRQAAYNAKVAGFDGVEIHGANGYLLDQFLHESTNQRHDRYGGSLEKRARLMLEVTDAVISVWGAKRVGVHLSPRSDKLPDEDTHLVETFRYVAAELGKRQIGFIFVRESIKEGRLGLEIKKAFGGVYIANQKITKELAEHALKNNQADAVAFGNLFISNPDLPHRFSLNAPLNSSDPTTFYTPGAKGYTDYPALQGTFDETRIN